MTRYVILMASLGLAMVACRAANSAEDLQLQLRYQQESSPGSGRYHRLERAETWKPQETAIIVCDAWDYHHCLNAVRRLEQFAPRLDKVLATARRRGVTIIHSPSDCMHAYADHPSRRRAMETPPVDQLPKDIRSWCSRIPSEEKGVYPIDQSDGGEDDDLQEHAQWAAKLKAMGRNPKMPWKKQSELIAIDPDLDFISDRGDEVWNILEKRQIKSVILAGVHTNMCVLGRPFGLRQLARNGKHVVLMRDMTDTMYNPQRWPFVSHFTGTDLIVSHIEKYVCPTITSDQLLGGKTFRFRGDTRPHLAIVMAEDEYETNQTLPKFASSLGKQFRVTLVFGSDKQRNEIPGLQVLKEADLALFSVRRRVLRPADMELVRQFVRAGKPVLGIRTASHAFSLRGQQPPQGFVSWDEFDADVFGGNYRGHYGNKLQATVKITAAAADHSILTGVPREPFPQGGSLYQTSPLASAATELLSGTVEGHPPEPVAWTFARADGGKSFYTSMGHKADFENEAFLRLLQNAVLWAAELPAEQAAAATAPRPFAGYWSPIEVPSSWQSHPLLKDYQGVGWYRCAVRLPADRLAAEKINISVQPADSIQAWFNGDKLSLAQAGGRPQFEVDARLIRADDANLLVVRTEGGGLDQVPVLVTPKMRLPLQGRWQFRMGSDTDFSNMPLPARFGAATDILFEPISD